MKLSEANLIPGDVVRVSYSGSEGVEVTIMLDRKGGLVGVGADGDTWRLFSYPYPEEVSIQFIKKKLKGTIEEMWDRLEVGMRVRFEREAAKSLFSTESSYSELDPSHSVCHNNTEFMSKESILEVLRGLKDGDEVECVIDSVSYDGRCEKTAIGEVWLETVTGIECRIYTDRVLAGDANPYLTYIKKVEKETIEPGPFTLSADIKKEWKFVDWTDPDWKGLKRELFEGNLTRASENHSHDTLELGPFKFPEGTKKDLEWCTVTEQQLTKPSLSTKFKTMMDKYKRMAKEALLKGSDKILFELGLLDADQEFTGSEAIDSLDEFLKDKFKDDWAASLKPLHDIKKKEDKKK